MSVDATLHVIKQSVLVFELITHLYPQHPLPSYALPQRVELLVLILYDLLVVSVNLLVVHLALVWAFGLVAIAFLLGEKGGAIRLVLRVGLFVGVVSEAHVLTSPGLRRWSPLHGCEVFLQTWVVGLPELC